MKRVARVAVVPALALGIVGALAAPAAGQVYPPAGTCALGVSNSVVTQGGQTTVSTTGGPSCYAPNSTVNLEVNPPLGSTTTNSAGQFSVVVTIPSSVSPGAHTITATGPGAAGGTLVLNVGITVTAPAAPAQPVDAGIAFTGADSTTWAWIGLAMIVVGITLFVGARRRSRVGATITG